MKALHLPIADPCHEDWDAMDPQQQGRFCGKCTKHVHDLSAMTQDEADALLRQRAGSRICVRYEHDDEGRIRFRRPAALALAAVAIAACTPHTPPAPRAEQDHQVVEPATPVVPTRATMGEAPPIEVAAPPHQIKGEIRAVLPEPVHVKKGDIAVPNEPCDEAPAATKPK
jgi:hypothetical protein